MKRAKYADAIFWIAWNDNLGGGDDEERISYYLSAALVADLWGVTTAKVAHDVYRLREKEGLPITPTS